MAHVKPPYDEISCHMLDRQNILKKFGKSSFEMSMFADKHVLFVKRKIQNLY